VTLSAAGIEEVISISA